MWSVVDFHVSRSSKRRVQVRVEVRLKVEALAKAFVRTAVDRSSDPPIAALMSKSRTNQLLKENETLDKAAKMRTKIDHIGSIHTYWSCKVAVCDNYMRWCYVHQATHEHFEIRENEVESFAVLILKGEASVAFPPHSLIELWQTRPNKLTVNPHNGRSRVKKNKQRSMSSSPDNDSAVLLKMMREQGKMSLQNQVMRMKERVEEQEERYEQRALEREARKATISSLYGNLSHPYTSQRQATPIYATDAAVPASKPASSSPVNGAGKPDNRSTVREFMRWLVEQQPDEDKAEYKRAREVAVEQMWTIGDLKAMSTSISAMYHIATGEPFRLKDGVVRHFR